MSEKQVDSRYSRRVPAHYGAVLKVPAGPIEGTVIQVSEGGVLFLSHKPVEIDTKAVLSMRVFANEPEVEFEGVLIYRLKEREAAGTFVYGVRFEGLDDLQKDEIARVLRYSAVKDRYASKPSETASD